MVDKKMWDWMDKAEGKKVGSSYANLMKEKQRQGWQGESTRHSMARYGIKTGRKQNFNVLVDGRLIQTIPSVSKLKAKSHIPYNSWLHGVNYKIVPEKAIDYSKLDSPIVEKPRVILPELDAQIMRIESPYKDSDYWHAEVSLYESLGEMGEYYTFDYDSKPTVDEIKKDAKKYLLDERKRFNNSIISAREEGYLKAIRKLHL